MLQHLILLIQIYFSCCTVMKDIREGDDITLECRFSPPESQETLTYNWLLIHGHNKYDNAAINSVPLNKNYKLNYAPENGVYDLRISNASYERDNGKFECKVKAGGSGADLHAQQYSLTVLTAPQEPAIAPGAHVTVTEGKRQELTCSSLGGSPDPQVQWFRDGMVYPLETALKNGGARDQPTTATLTVVPSKDDDGATYRCEVWNRALQENRKLTSTVTLSVNYFPRVEVGPENPLRVIRDSQATLECLVDAKPAVSGVRWTRNGRFYSSAQKHSIHRVSIQDAGKYTCSADNGLGKVGEQEIFLDVLFGPTVQLEAKTREAEEGDSVYIKCNVTSNPNPITVEWIREDRSDFRQAGDILRLPHVAAEHSGTYVCRAVNILAPATARRIERIGNASIALLVRHRPGRARIMPDSPVVTEGATATLTCAATPPGWPAPQYRWFRLDPNNGQSTIVATGTKYSISMVTLANEGQYNCQATNELGSGDVHSVQLEVIQPPAFTRRLKPLETRREGETGFTIECGAKGKPKPHITWLKNDEELTADVNLFEVRTENLESSTGAVTVRSVLKFHGRARPNGNQLVPSDRGTYICAYHNEVKKVESSMHLKIEHQPIVLNEYNKVAYDLSETAQVLCKVQACPKPEFKWYYGTNIAPLQSSSEGHYSVNNTSDDDTYTSVLNVGQIRKSDYGEYTCHVLNRLGEIRQKIRLQSKGAPEKPTKIAPLFTGHNFVTLNWQPGFNGGITNTKYFISYRKVPSDDEIVVEGCGILTQQRVSDWLEVDCQQKVPCNVSHLDQHQSYLFKVKALNTKGISDSSGEIRIATRVDRIPVPQRVSFDPAANSLSIHVPSTCLPLVAVVETVNADNSPLPTWQIADTLPLPVSGLNPSYKEVDLDILTPPTANRYYKEGGRGLADEPIGVNDRYAPRLRVKFCLRTRHEYCGDYVEAELGSAFIREASALATPTLIAIIVSCIVFVLFVSLLLIFCRCKRNQTVKNPPTVNNLNKDYEMDSVVRPTMIVAQSPNQAPPPYYPTTTPNTTGLENKALDLALSSGLDANDQKQLHYALQNGGGYHLPAHHHHHAHHPGGATPDWANMGYIENNSYSNSQNGGSVNSQDSLWQMKMASAGSTNSTTQLVPPPVGGGVQTTGTVGGGTYGYDPITHGGYGTVDDYAPYPGAVLPPPPSNNSTADEYGMRNGTNPSRQDYHCTDPYASVHKPKKRIEQHLESPYHDVSGLPDPYLDQIEDEKPPHHHPAHMSLSYEESLESGYSTPNSRTRRVIREIIV